MTDVAKLGVEVDTRTAAQGTKDLDDFAAAGKRAGGVADDISARYAKLGLIIGGTVATAIVSVTALMIGMARRGIEVIESYARLAEVAGTSAETMSGFALAAQLSGTSLDVVALSVSRLGRQIGDARLGDSSKAGLFAALGIDVRDGRDAAEVMVDVAKALMGMTDQTIAGEAAQKLLGVSFSQLRPFMRDLIEHGTEYGRVSNESAARAKEYADNMAKIQFNIQQVSIALGEKFLPILVDVSRMLEGTSRNARGVESSFEGLATFVTNVFLIPFQTIAVVGAEVMFVLRGIGGQIGTFAAQVDALKKLNFREALFIGAEFQNDMRIARTELDAYTASVMNLGKARGQVRPAAKPDGMDESAIKSVIAEEKLRQMGAAEKVYAARIAAEQTFAKRYAAAISTSNKAAQEAHKQGLLTQEELVRQLQANEDARLKVLMLSLEKEKAFQKAKGDEKAVTKVSGQIDEASAARVANEVIANAQVESIRAQAAEKERVARLKKADEELTDLINKKERERVIEEAADERRMQRVAMDMDRLQRSQQTELQQLNQSYLEKMIVIDLWEAEDINRRRLAEEARNALAKWAAEERTKIEDREIKKREAAQRAQQAGLQTFLGNLSGLMNTENKKAFEFGKKAAIVNARVQGALAVIAAWKAGMLTVGPWAPFVAAAYAAAAVINAENLVNNIKNQQFGGGGSITGVSGGVPQAIGQGSSGIAEPESAKPPAITTIINMPPGEFFSRKSVRELLEMLNENSEDGGRVIVVDK